MKHAGAPMSSDGNEELYQLLLDTAEDSPTGVLANCIEVMTTVFHRRLAQDPVLGTLVDVLNWSITEINRRLVEAPNYDELCGS